MSRKIAYKLNGVSQFVYENTDLPPSPSPNPESSKLFTSFRKMEEDKFKLIKSCDKVQEDNSISDMNIENTIYLDTISNKTGIKKQTKFLLAPILPKLNQLGIKYVVLFPSIVELYTKTYGYAKCSEILGKEFEAEGYDKNKFVCKLLKNRSDLATKVYEPIGFKSYVPCPGYLEGDSILLYIINMIPDLTINDSFEYLQLIDNRYGEQIMIKIPNHYWMIAKVVDIYKILLNECLADRIIKFKKLGSCIRVIDGATMEINDIVRELKKLIDELSIDNLLASCGKIKEIFDKESNFKLISSLTIDKYFVNNMELLLNIAGQLGSEEIRPDGLTTCLNMIKEIEDEEEWILRGGSITGFYLNKLNSENAEINKYKKLYQKYKIKYLASKKP